MKATGDHIMSRQLSLLLVAFALALPAQESSLTEFVPDGVTPDARQRGLILAAAAMVGGCRVEYDQDGNVRSLELSNHQVDVPGDASKADKAMLRARPGIDDDTFLALGGLPALKGLGLRQQPLSAHAFSVLGNWPDLEAFRIERNEWGEDGADFMLHLNMVPDLRWLELKHLFNLDETRVDELEGFPQLLRLELDNASAQSACLPFLERCPQVRDLELHRSNLTNDEIGRLVDALPLLERFELKPQKQVFDAGCLAHFPRFEHLRVFDFVRWKPEALFWEGGVEHLLAVPSLECIGYMGSKLSHPALQRLLEERPALRSKEDREYAVTFDYLALSR